jgi:transcriptional regulator with XRE-family HTH domain
MLRFRRAELGLTLEQVATLAGVSICTIHKLENEWGPLGPSVVTLVKVARALEVPARWVLNAAADHLVEGEVEGEGAS